MPAGPASLERRRHELVQRESGSERPFERVVRSKKATATSCGGLRRDAAGGLRLTLEGLEDSGGLVGAPDAAVRLDQVGAHCTSHGSPELSSSTIRSTRLERHDRGVGIAAAELQQSEAQRPPARSQQEAGCGVGSETGLRSTAALFVPPESSLHAGDRRLRNRACPLGRLSNNAIASYASGEWAPSGRPEVELGQLDQRPRQAAARASMLHADSPGEESARDLVPPPRRAANRPRRPSGARSPRPSGPCASSTSRAGPVTSPAIVLASA
jgi:hypothetical protein